MGKKEDKITVSMAGKNKQVTANQKRMAANAWRDAKDASSRARLKERYKKQGYSAADIKAIIAAAASGPRAPVKGMKKDPQGLKRTFRTKSPYSGKTSSIPNPRKKGPLSSIKKQKGRG